MREKKILRWASWLSLSSEDVVHVYSERERLGQVREGKKILRFTCGVIT